MKDSNRGDIIYGDNAPKAQDDNWAESDFDIEDPSSWENPDDSELKPIEFDIIC